MYFVRVVTKHIGEREGSSLKKIKDALERYLLDYEVDYNFVRSKVDDLETDYQDKIGYVIVKLKTDVQQIRTLAKEFVQLSMYGNKFSEALRTSKNRIIEEIYIVNASLDEYLVKRKLHDTDCTDEESAMHDGNDKPCHLYVREEQRVVCESVFNEFTQVMDDILTLEGLQELTTEDVDMLRRNSEKLLDVSEVVVVCFGDYFEKVSESIKVLKEIDPELYQEQITDTIINKARPGELRTIYAPLYQDQRLIEEIINSYTRGYYTKEKVVSLMSGNMMTEIIGRIERFAF